MASENRPYPRTYRLKNRYPFHWARAEKDALSTDQLKKVTLFSLTKGEKDTLFTDQFEKCASPMYFGMLVEQKEVAQVNTSRLEHIIWI